MFFVQSLQSVPQGAPAGKVIFAYIGVRWAGQRYRCVVPTADDDESKATLG